jgi:hypothetical protein
LVGNLIITLLRGGVCLGLGLRLLRVLGAQHLAKPVSQKLEAPHELNAVALKIV